MTGDEREPQTQGQPPVAEQPRAVVVAVDATRLDLYARTLRMAQIPARATLDLDEAEALLTNVQPSVLVLDHGLPRLSILRLYGLVRESLDGPRVKVLFVGQEGKAGPDDYYLPGEPSPLGVAAQVGEMVAEADAAADAEPTSAVLAEADPAGVDPAADQDDIDRAPALVGAATAGAPGAGAIPTPPVEGAPPPKRRRLDVLMFRIGIVLLIVGGLLAFIRPESFTLPMSVPPTVVPAAPTPQPAASPSPAAFFDDATHQLRFSDLSR